MFYFKIFYAKNKYYIRYYFFWSITIALMCLAHYSSEKNCFNSQFKDFRILKYKMVEAFIFACLIYRVEFYFILFKYLQIELIINNFWTVRNMQIKVIKLKNCNVFS